MPTRPPRAHMMARGVAAHAAKVRHDVKRASREYRAWYKSPEWKRIRAAHLSIEPLCRMCRANGVLNDGTRKIDGTHEPDPRRRGLIVDHVEPHRGDRAKFFGGSKATLCKDHHDRVKQREEAAARKAAAT